MVAKILAALAIPLIVATLVGAVLRLTHHSAVPALDVPVTQSANTGVAPGSATSAQFSACDGIVPGRFSGIAVPKQPARSIFAYTQKLDAKLHVVEFYNAFRRKFERGEADQAVQAGLIPLIQLNPWRVSEQQIASGVWDRHIENYANDVKKFGCTVILSFGHEMNGWWYPWGAPRTSPANFIAAWRHIHDIFEQEHVRNVIWSWDPSHQHGEIASGKIAAAASEWYPGDKYVDWIGLDGYLGTNRSGHAQNFREIFSFQLSVIRKIAPHKKVYLAETGVVPGPAATAQIAELYSGAAAFHLAGVVWFDAVAKHDYRLGINSAEDAAYGKGVIGFLKG